jgi:hypothetical protein
MIAAVERALPRLSRREWGELAIAAAARAGLEEPDIESLRVHLRDQFAIDGPGRAPATTEHGIGLHDRAAPQSPRGARARRIPGRC